MLVLVALLCLLGMASAFVPMGAGRLVRRETFFPGPVNGAVVASSD